MFAPNKVWRRWHRRINVEQKRFALVSALAGTAIPALVLARGHRIENIPEVPLVLDNTVVNGLTKTKNAVALLKSVGAYADCEKVYNTRTVRAGKGKARNRKWRRRLGPLIIHNGSTTLVQAFRNIPGVDFSNVQRLNLLKLAPGGHLGRFVIWTKDAFEQLDKVYGTYRAGTSAKKGYTLPRPQLTNADIFRIINAPEVQATLRDKRKSTRKLFRHNPLKNKNAMQKLNPYSNTLRRIQVLKGQEDLKNKAARLQAVKEGKPASAAVKTARKAKTNLSQKYKKLSEKYYKNLA
jgi:large subunit ribosomal protein L4e